MTARGSRRSRSRDHREEISNKENRKVGKLCELGLSRRWERRAVKNHSVIPSSFGLRLPRGEALRGHSFVIRHSSFVVFLSSVSISGLLIRFNASTLQRFHGSEASLKYIFTFEKRPLFHRC
jgi:hypothetical protein